MEEKRGKGLSFLISVRFALAKYGHLWFKFPVGIYNHTNIFSLS